MWLIEADQHARLQPPGQRRHLAPQHRPPLGDLHRPVHPRQLPAPDRQHDPVRVHGRDHRAARRQAARARDADRDRRRRARDVAGRAHTSTDSGHTIGASGVVFGYATYLFARGFFNRSMLELADRPGRRRGLGRRAVSSVVPHTGISWQGHVCGAIGGVVAAYMLRNDGPPTAGRDAPRRRRSTSCSREHASRVASAPGSLRRRCGSSRASSRPGASTSATTSARSPSTSPARTAARRSTASSTCTRSPSPTSPPRCARRCTTRRRCCSPPAWTRSAASSSARATSRSTPSCAGCSRA